MISKIAHLSDLHGGQPVGRFAAIRRLVGRHDSHNAEQTRRIVDTINARPDRGEILTLVTGDIVDRSTAMEFDEMAGELARLETETEIVPGNHDKTSTRWQGMGFSRAGAGRYNWAHGQATGKAPDFPYSRDFGDWRLLCLDSSAHNEKGTLFARGRIGDRQLAWLAMQLADTRPTVIALHHHPTMINPTLAVVDATEFLTVANRPHVIVLFGHRHREGHYSSTDYRPELFASGKTVKTLRFRLIDPVARSWEWVNVK